VTRPRPREVTARIVRAWVLLYTAPLPRQVRWQRRVELAADLHDHLADLAARRVPGRRATLEILRRWAAGMPADLAWSIGAARQEVMTMHERWTRGALAVAGWACAVLVAALGLWSAVAGLRHGWRELPRHWWSVLAAAGVVVSIAGLVATVALTPRPGRGQAL
jgi:hypothetical protein